MLCLADANYCLQLVHSKTQASHAGPCGVASMLQGAVILKGLKVYQPSHAKQKMNCSLFSSLFGN